MTQTVVYTIDDLQAQMAEAEVRAAAAALSAGRLVAFPTETVYGLGANGLDESAVRAVYAAKGRAFTNPLALHCASLERALPWIADPPLNLVARLAPVLPGPIMLVFWRSEALPGWMVADGPKVGVRVPSHALARALLTACPEPIVATSANLSGRPTATRAADVLNDLQGRIAYLLDSPEPVLGLESTVLDLTATPPVVLRPGAVSRETLAELLGFLPSLQAPSVPPRPVFLEGVRVLLVQPGSAESLTDLAASLPHPTALVASQETLLEVSGYDHLCSLGPRSQPKAMAGLLFTAMRDLSPSPPAAIVLEAMPEDEALMHRMSQLCTETIG